MQKTQNETEAIAEYIWPGGIKIEVLGVTGEYAAGKTLFLLTIDPTNTLLFDFEKSAGTYEGLGFRRIDVPEVMGRKFPDGYKPIDTFRLWLTAIESIEPGKHSVIAVDTIGDIETGLADYVKSKHSDYGFKTAAAFEAMGGVFWGNVKSFWKQVLAGLATKCQTFAFTSHLRQKWVGGAPTTKREPTGKATLFELTSLYLWLERPTDKHGKQPDKPSANVLKSRLADTRINPDTGEPEVIPTLPPRLPVATPAAIRKYILTPPDYAKLKVGERIQEKVMSADEKLLIENETAKAQQATQETALARLDRQAVLREQAGKAPVSGVGPAPATTTPVPPVPNRGSLDLTQTDNGNSEMELRAGDPCDAGQKAEIKRLFDKLNIPHERAKAVIERRGVTRLAALTAGQAGELIANLNAKITEQEAASVF